MPPEICDHHVQLASDIAVIKNSLTKVETKICKHIDEGECQGGFRDRLIILEQEVSALKKAEWFRLITAGLIGGLMGNIAPEVVVTLVRWITVKG